MNIKNYISIAVITFINFIYANAQTNVSGSIVNDVTWTLSNSPYHVTSNIYVFPGVNLTIEPGVKVLFDGNYFLEIRGNIKAVGNNGSMIYFCGNPVISGNDTFYTLWNKILIEQNNKGTGEFRHCVFKDANTAIEAQGVKTKISDCWFENNTFGLSGYNIYNTTYVPLKNCTFLYNHTGLQYSILTEMSNCKFMYNQRGMYSCHQTRIKNCEFLNNKDGINIYNGSMYNSVFLNNETGIKAPNFDNFNNIIDTISKCTFQNNEVAIDDSAFSASTALMIINNDISNNEVGYKVLYAGDITGAKKSIVKNNKICHNNLYNVYNLNNLNKNFTDNCFCTDDQTTIENKIFDGYDDPNYGLITYNVYDTSCQKKKSNHFKKLNVDDKDTGCLNFAECFNFSGLKQLSFKNNLLQLYPNPVGSLLNIGSDIELTGEITIYDSKGLIVFKHSYKNDENPTLSVNTEFWNSGIYIIKYADSTAISTSTFIKL
jgi:hypothetical protein